jgi:hypothetical protein
MKLHQLFGVPYLVCPMETEAQGGELEQRYKEWAILGVRSQTCRRHEPARCEPRRGARRWATSANTARPCLADPPSPRALLRLHDSHLLAPSLPFKV